MSHICYRCGAKGSERVGEKGLFRTFGYDMQRDFPFSPPTSHIIRMCKKCRDETKGGAGLRSKPLYHPIDEALKNA